MHSVECAVVRYFRHRLLLLREIRSSSIARGHAVALRPVTRLEVDRDRPLTAVAGRYTDDRRDNFDIYLPEWLARHNKVIFTTLYVAGMVVTAVRWAGWLR